MLYNFLNSNRDELIMRCRDKLAKRGGTAELQADLENGVPLFLRQLTDILSDETMTNARADAGEGTANEPSIIGGGRD